MLFAGIGLLLMIIGFPACISAEDEIRLIVRGDDMGMTYGSLEAFKQGFNHGVLTVGAMQVPAP